MANEILKLPTRLTIAEFTLRGMDECISSTINLLEKIKQKRNNLEATFITELMELAKKELVGKKVKLTTLNYTKEILITRVSSRQYANYLFVLHYKLPEETEEKIVTFDFETEFEIIE